MTRADVLELAGNILIVAGGFLILGGIINWLGW